MLTVFLHYANTKKFLEILEWMETGQNYRFYRKLLKNALKILTGPAMESNYRQKDEKGYKAQKE